MARKKTSGSNQKLLEQYEHKDKQRLNNPPMGLVDAHTDNGGQKKKAYQYDPHLDPHLQWAGKAEHTSFDVPTVSLHVHERIDPRRIMESVRKEKTGPYQPSLFEDKKPLREAIEFYKHKENWSNRLIAGDSLLIMNSLLEKEGMGGKVQMIYIDPPYGIKYGSNFQPFVNKRKVKDGKDEDLTAEPEMIKAFRDTWELGIHSYLTYLRDRLLLAWELLSESGSVFVQINDNNLHLIRIILDEIFGCGNCINIIPFKKRASFLSRFGKGLFELFDYIIWYAKDVKKVKVNTLYIPANKQDLLRGEFRYFEDESGVRTLTEEDIINPSLDLSKVFRTHSGSKKSESPKYIDPIEINGYVLEPPSGHEWKADPKGMENLKKLNRLVAGSPTRPYKIYYTDFPYQILNNLWDDTLAEQYPIYAVQTDELPVQRCILLTTMPGDLVLDITCGGGTTSYVAEQWGRRWITCDTSRIAVTLAKQRLMTASFDYYELAYPNEGVGSGFKYKHANRLKLEIVANNITPEEISFIDRPLIDNKRLRVTGPFTVEAVPAPVARSFEDIESGAVQDADTSVVRSGETLRQSEWRDELLRAGVRAKGGKLIEFTRVEPMSGTRYLQAEAETKEDDPKRVLVCFGPEHAPLEPRMVDLAMEEAEHLKPKVQIILFCAFQFDEEASKDIDETNWPGVTLLKAQMNADLLTDDLKKKRASNESFWLIGQPDVSIRAIENGSDEGKYQIEVQGFDYYNPKTGTVESGGKADIAMWMLDTDYDGRSLFPSQVFFPMAGAKEGWATLSENLKAEIDEDKIEVFGGTVSLPFMPGKAVAVKIIDARGIESLKIIRP